MERDLDWEEKMSKTRLLLPPWLRRMLRRTRSYLPKKRAQALEVEVKAMKRNFVTRNNSLCPRRGTSTSLNISYCGQELGDDDGRLFPAQTISITVGDGQKDGGLVSWLDNDNNMTVSARASPFSGPLPKMPEYNRPFVLDLFTGLIGAYIGRQMTNPGDASRVVNSIL
ncbi:hypothetical protein N657DRAFT_456322 [Parathielavia appendiculata]|uniref:Uncharacterized protein n=1 Tax=Parathielavia appendiculata TaxID=2587402 RepID=A0AAN6TYZ6_9PEZI|nr:hypothetical protein N657DRAFT_456322 [Parathielavia appendiculata]